jgi:hypothetical protein
MRQSTGGTLRFADGERRGGSDAADYREQADAEEEGEASRLGKSDHRRFLGATAIDVASRRWWAGSPGGGGVRIVTSILTIRLVSVAPLDSSAPVESKYRSSTPDVPTLVGAYGLNGPLTGCVVSKPPLAMLNSRRPRNQRASGARYRLYRVRRVRRTTAPARSTGGGWAS